jgi:hypothetical protein
MGLTAAWINDNGDITHASAGTPIKPDAASYNTIPFAVTAFGQCLGMLALASAHKFFSLMKIYDAVSTLVCPRAVAPCIGFFTLPVSGFRRILHTGQI